MKSLIIDVEQAVIDSEREVCGYVGVGRKNSKSEYWKRDSMKG